MPSPVNTSPAQHKHLGLSFRRKEGKAPENVVTRDRPRRPPGGCSSLFSSSSSRFSFAHEMRYLFAKFKTQTTGGNRR